MARNLKQDNLKIHPTVFLTEAEKYLYHFWEPKIGHKVVYCNKKYIIKKIIDNQAIVGKNRMLWLQDLGWKPTIDDCDDIAVRFNTQITPEQIIFKHGNRRCIFAKPKTVEEYRDIIRQLRVLNAFKETK